MSVEKFLALYFPFKTRRLCTVQIAKRVVFITFLIYAAFESQFFFIIDARIDNGVSYCKFVRVSESYELTFNQIDSVLYSFGPFVIMTITNCAIIYKFLRAKYKTRRDGTESTNQALSKTAVRGCLMLVTVSVTFIILTGPGSVVYSITHYPHPMTEAVIRIIGDLNHAINGILYCVVGSRFRKEVLDTVCCRKRKTRSQTNISTSVSTLSTSNSIDCPINNSSVTHVTTAASPI